MKKILFTIMLLISSVSYAHDWPTADAWAYKQIIMTEDILACADDIKVSFQLYIDNGCSLMELSTDSAMLIDELITNMSKHSINDINENTENIVKFIVNHFNDTSQAIKAITSTTIITEMIEFISKQVLEKINILKHKEFKIIPIIIYDDDEVYI